MKVGLFIPCYVDALYPEAGVATYKLLKHFGVDVGYPEKQTCCGQPMGNAGFESMSKSLALIPCFLVSIMLLLHLLLALHT